MVLFYAFDCYDKCKYNLTSNPTINQAKGETLHHTFRKQKLDVEKQEQCQYPYKTIKESLPVISNLVPNGPICPNVPKESRPI